MKKPSQRSEAGIALLIVIIALLLVTAVATGMVIYSTSETKVDASYRDQQIALFAAKAGLEEARDRMLASNANPITLPTTLPGTSGGAAYIYASDATPWLSGSTYGDTEFASETGALGLSLSGSWYSSYASKPSYSGPSANPVPYQWVRINLKTNETLDSSSGVAHWVNTAEPAGDQVLFDSTSGTECISSLTCVSGDDPQPVYELTSSAATPTGATRILQEDVAAYVFNLNFDSPLTIPGTVGSFSGGSSSGYQIDGSDGQGSAPAISGCAANTAGGPAVAVSGTSNAQTVQKGFKRPANYSGTDCTYDSGSNGCIGSASMPSGMSTPAELDQTLQTIEQNANACLGCSGSGGGSYSYSNIVSALPGGTWSNPATSPQIVYVNGDLDVSAASGSGILVVTGNLTYSGNSNWNGIILIVGQGTTTFNINGGGNGEFNGEFLVATTKDANGNELSNFGTADFNVNGGGGSGIFYNSCWINNVQKPTSYVVLSSKEISQ